VKGYATIYPDSVDGWWNGGGGQNGYLCIGGTACEKNINDVLFMRLLLQDLATIWPYDASRVYVTGISNGAVMTHRLACEAADVFSAFAPVAHGNQYAAAGGSCPAGPRPMLYIHGSADPAILAPYEGSEWLCRNGMCGRVVSAAETIADWLQRNGCGPRSAMWLPNWAADGTLTRADRYTCSDAVVFEHRFISGGGHTWPDGWQYLGEWLVGRTERDWNGNEAIWDFLKSYRLP
jgi:polyhydroxybutyrate depolymerase